MAGHAEVGRDRVFTAGHMAQLLLHDGQAGHDGRLALLGRVLGDLFSVEARTRGVAQHVGGGRAIVRSTIDFAEHDVHRADDRDSVRDHVTAPISSSAARWAKPGARIFSR